KERATENQATGDGEPENFLAPADSRQRYQGPQIVHGSHCAESECQQRANPAARHTACLPAAKAKHDSSVPAEEPAKLHAANLPAGNRGRLKDRVEFSARRRFG